MISEENVKKLKDLLGLEDLIEGIVEQTNTLINLEMLAGEPIALTPTYKDMFVEAFLEDLDSKVTEDELSAYLSVLEDTGAKVGECIEGLVGIAQAQSEAEVNVRM